MTEFWIYFEKGFKHILDLFSYNPILFLIVLTVTYTFKDWKRVLLLVTLFTIGYILSVLLAIFGVIVVKGNLLGLIIPITILIVALFNFFTVGKSTKQDSISIMSFITLFFGIVHGLYFSGNFNAIAPVTAHSKIVPLLEFASGVEAAQILVVLLVLIISYIVQTFFRFSKRDWTLVMSSFVIGVILPMVISNNIWNT